MSPIFFQEPEFSYCSILETFLFKPVTKTVSSNSSHLSSGDIYKIYN